MTTIEKNSDNVSSEQRLTRGMGLCLSGGGFRATLYHLGVVRFLRDRELLKRVTHICSVSGGSILGAHLVLNWERYTGDEQSFAEAAGELIAFTQSDLRGNVFRRWLLSFAALGIPRWLHAQGWQRTALLQASYDQLYQRQTLNDLRTSQNGSIRPELHVLATSMTTGKLVSFSNAEVLFNDTSEPNRFPAGSVPVAYAVAASSAFPPAFPPIRMHYRTFGNEVSPEIFPNDHYLTDGGVFDNLGIRKMLWLEQARDPGFDYIIVSDAQCAWGDEFKNVYRFIWNRATRSADLLMNRVSWCEDNFVKQACKAAGSKLLLCRLQESVQADYALSNPVQVSVQNIRTDLDRFQDGEVNALIHHGQACARATWEKLVESNSSPTATSTSASTSIWQSAQLLPVSEASLKGSQYRKSGLFNARDWSSWALWTLLLLWLVVLPVGTLIVQSIRAAEAEAAKREAKEQSERADKAEKELKAQKARQTAHVEAKVLVVRTLGEVMMAESPDEFEIVLERWKLLKKRLMEESFFFDLYLDGKFVKNVERHMEVDTVPVDNFMPRMTCSVITCS